MAGLHEGRISFPELADIDDPRKNVNLDLRRKLWIEYLDIVGPFEPKREPSESYRALFVCGHAPGNHQPSCARKIVIDLAQRAYRRPPADQEIANLLKLPALAQKRGDSFEEGIRLPVQAVL